MPLAITVETALLAVVTSSKTASRVLLTGGTGVNRTQILVTIAIVPSDPQRSPVRS